MAIKLTKKQRKAMIDQLIDKQLGLFEDDSPRDLRETIIEHMCDGVKGWNQMTDEELQKEHDDAFKEEDEDDL